MNNKHSSEDTFCASVGYLFTHKHYYIILPHSEGLKRVIPFFRPSSETACCTALLTECHGGAATGPLWGQRGHQSALRLLAESGIRLPGADPPRVWLEACVEMLQLSWQQSCCWISWPGSVECLVWGSAARPWAGPHHSFHLTRPAAGSWTALGFE